MAVQSICLKSIVVEMVEKVIKIKDVLLKKDVLNVYKCMRGPLSVTFNENYIHAAFRQGNCAEDNQMKPVRNSARTFTAQQMKIFIRSFFSKSFSKSLMRNLIFHAVFAVILSFFDLLDIAEKHCLTLHRLEMSHSYFEKISLSLVLLWSDKIRSEI